MTTHTQHTLGPWKSTFNTDHYDAESEEQTGLVIRPDFDGQPMEIVCDTGLAKWLNIRAASGNGLIAGSIDPVIERCKANARLIAAAPDMLEALKAIVEGNTMAGEIDWTLGDVIQKHYQIARAAIASATGQEAR